MTVERAIVVDECGVMAEVIDAFGSRTGEVIFLDPAALSMAVADEQAGDVQFTGTFEVTVRGREYVAIDAEAGDKVCFLRGEDGHGVQHWIRSDQWDDALEAVERLPVYRVVHISAPRGRITVHLEPTRSLAELSVRWPTYARIDGTIHDPIGRSVLFGIGGWYEIQCLIGTQWLMASECRMSREPLCCVRPELYELYRTDDTPEQPTCEHLLVPAS